MNIEDLKKINAVIEFGSINKAADKLFISQPALSRIIRRTEEEYGITLFDRTQGKKIVLTEEGEMFRQAAREILLVHENLVVQLERHKNRSTNLITFGTAPQQAMFKFGEMVQWFYRHEPGYQLDTRAGSSRQLHLDVLRGEIDVALINVSRDFDELHYEKEERMHTYFYIGKNSPLLEKRHEAQSDLGPILRAEDLDGERFIVNTRGSASRKIFDDLVERYGLKVRFIEETNMYQRLKMADEGLGTYVLTMTGLSTSADWSRGDQERYACLDPEEDEESWRYIVCRRGFEETEKYKVLRRCLKET